MENFGIIIGDPGFDELKHAVEFLKMHEHHSYEARDRVIKMAVKYVDGRIKRKDDG